MDERIGISMNADMIDGSMYRFDEHLGYIASSGARWAEIIFHGLDVVINGRLDRARLREVRRICSSHDLRYALHLPYALNLLDPARGEEHAAVFRAGLSFASEIECPVVVYHAGSARLPDPNPDGASRRHDPAWRVYLDREAQQLERLADEALAVGVTIGVENPLRYNVSESYSYGVFPEELVEQVERIGKPNVGITLDFGHLYLLAASFGFDYLTAVKTLTPRAVHAHVHDNFGKPDSGEPYIHRLPYGLGDLHLPPGQGEVPLEEALPILLDGGYSGLLMLEIEFRLYPSFGDHVTSFKRLLASIGE